MSAHLLIFLTLSGGRVYPLCKEELDPGVTACVLVLRKFDTGGDPHYLRGGLGYRGLDSWWCSLDATLQETRPKPTQSLLFLVPHLPTVAQSKIATQAQKLEVQMWASFSNSLPRPHPCQDNLPAGCSHPPP